MSDDKTFMLEEYKALAAVLEQRVRAMQNLENVVVVAIAAFYAWLVTQQQSTWGQTLWGVPVLMATLGFCRVMTLSRRVVEVSEYLELLEKAFYGDIPEEEHRKHRRPWGAERFVRAHRTWRDYLMHAGTPLVFWLMLIVFTTLFWILRPSYAQLTPGGDAAATVEIITPDE
jgi:hypothetical protein